MATHNLKTWPAYFAAIDRGEKTFEVRINDRGFARGDRLVLVEYDLDADDVTGRQMYCEVTYLLDDPDFGVRPGYVVMAIVVRRRVGPSPDPFGQPAAPARSAVRDRLTPGPVFAARFDSECGGCGGTLEEGDRARMLDGEAMHAYCAESDGDF